MWLLWCLESPCVPASDCRKYRTPASGVREYNTRSREISGHVLCHVVTSRHSPKGVPNNARKPTKIYLYSSLLRLTASASNLTCDARLKGKRSLVCFLFHLARSSAPTFSARQRLGLSAKARRLSQERALKGIIEGVREKERKQIRRRRTRREKSLPASIS